MLLLVIITILTAFSLRFVLRHSTRWRYLRKLPHPASSNTLIGSLEILQNKEKVVSTLLQVGRSLGTHGHPAPLFTFRVAHHEVLIVTDPTIASHVLGRQLNLIKDPYIFANMQLLGSIHQPNIFSSLSSDPGTYWWAVRKGISPAFMMKNIKQQFHNVVSRADQVSGILKQAYARDQLVNIDAVLQRESLDVLGGIGFGIDFGALTKYSRFLQESIATHDEDDLFEVMRAASSEVQKRMTTPLRRQLRWVLPHLREGEAAMERYRSYMRSLLVTIKARGPPPLDDTTIAAHLLRLKDPATGKLLNDEQLASELGVLFFAGTETTGHSMAWALYLLARHPQQAAKVAAELDQMGFLVSPTRPNPPALQYDDLSKLRYLQCCIKESMRLYPVVASGSPRNNTQPIYLGGHYIPAGIIIIPMFLLIHRSSSSWQDAEEFVPERWLEPGACYVTAPSTSSCDLEVRQREEDDAGGADEGFSDLDSARGWSRARKYMPFSYGARDCVGQSLAKMNMAAQLAILLSRFTVELPPELQGKEVLPAEKITMQPKDGLRLRCIPRW